MPIMLALVGCAGPTPEARTEQKERLVFAFQRQKDPALLRPEVEALGRDLSQALGREVGVKVPTAYSATVQALISNQAQIAYMSSLPYLLAKREAPIEIIFAEERAGKTAYDAVFVVAKDSPAQSLADLRGKSIAWTSATSSSGYVFPFAHLVKEGLLKPGAKPDTFFSKSTFAGGYDKALLAVVNGQADVAAVSSYTVEGETADLYLPEALRARLRVLARVPNVPTHLIAIRSDLDDATKDAVRSALAAQLARNPERMRDVYGAAKLVPVSGDSHVKSAEEALKATGLDVKGLVE